MDALDPAIIIWSHAAAMAAYGGMSIHLAAAGRTWRAGIASGAMFAAAILSLLWAIAGVAVGARGDPAFLSALLVLDILRYGAWFAFLLALLRTPDTVPGKGFAWRPLAAVACVILVPHLLLHAAVWSGLAAPTTLSGVSLILTVVTLVFALVLVEQVFRNVTTDSLWGIKPLCLGLGAAILFDLYLYTDALLFKRVDRDAFAMRGLAHALVVPMLVISTLRTRDWGAKIQLSQKAAFRSATMLLVGAYLVFMAAVGYYVRSFGGEWGRAFQIAVAFVAFLILGLILFSGSMRAKLRVALGKHFFSYRYDYREEWLRFTQTLSTQTSPQEMGQQVIRGLADLVESPGGAIWLRAPGQSAFIQTARWNLPSIETPEPDQGELARFMLESGWVINIEEYRSFPRRYNNLSLPEWLAGLPQAWLVVPLMVRQELTGFVILASARTFIDINWEVNDLLRTAGRQAASFLAQMEATEALLEARKFDSFNRMSAFVVHDLKNIVTQLALMLKNAERHRANPEFQKDMLMTVEHSVERMRQLMLQLREGATPPGTPVGVALASIIERIAAARRSEGVEIDVQVSEALMTRGHEDRMERVIGHLVQNGLDATEGRNAGSAPRVTIRLQRSGGAARVEVEDTGAGMSQEFIRERLFKPFQTTKKAGMGIGAFESFQYVQELGGKVTVDSEVGSGTRIALMLPLFDRGGGSDLHAGAGASA